MDGNKKNIYHIIYYYIYNIYIIYIINFVFWGIRVACYKTVICNVSHDDWRPLVAVYVKSVYNWRSEICRVTKGRGESDFGLRKLRLS